MAGYIVVMGVLLQIIISIFMLEAIAEIPSRNKKVVIKCVIVTLLWGTWVLAIRNNNWWYLFAVLLDIISYSTYLIIMKRQSFSYMLSIVMAVNIINAFSGFLIAIIFTFLFQGISVKSKYYWLTLVCGYLLRLLPLFSMCWIGKKFSIYKILGRKRRRNIIIIIGILYQFARIIIHLFSKETRDVRLFIAVTIMCIGFVLGILWIIDWYYNELEKKNLIEENQLMSQRLHKSKEIFPVLSSILDHMDTEHATLDLQNITDELHQLCENHIKENQSEERKFKIYPETGISILDEQIKQYGRESASKEINFDVFINIPVNEALSDNSVKKLDFLRLVGDLMRNSFNAIEKKKDCGGNILLIMGYAQDIFQIELYDDGQAFPISILDKFGIRGNTDGGSGNGIIDILDILTINQASFQLTEYTDNETFTKGISITWNQKNERIIKTHRASNISGENILLKYIDKVERY